MQALDLRDLGMSDIKISSFHENTRDFTFLVEYVEGRRQEKCSLVFLYSCFCFGIIPGSVQGLPLEELEDCLGCQGSNLGWAEHKESTLHIVLFLLSHNFPHLLGRD